ncbi:hypothetical protein MRX96_028437 [Rhipicephalus microplus]
MAAAMDIDKFLTLGMAPDTGQTQRRMTALSPAKRLKPSDAEKRPEPTLYPGEKADAGHYGIYITAPQALQAGSQRKASHPSLVQELFNNLFSVNRQQVLLKQEVPVRLQYGTFAINAGRLIPFLELVVAHVSILTMLAISFERYYAICKPLKAGYTCTKTRALGIITTVWLLSMLVTSPMLLVSQYGWVEYYDGSTVPSCGTSFGRPWRRLYIVATMVLLFVLPFFVLVTVYTSIACQLMRQRAIGCTPPSEQAQLRARHQLVFMLVAVVVSFFVCLLPYRVLILWIIVSPAPVEAQVSLELFYSLLYLCRVMLYLNSAMNPILYNAMSSKFRDAFFSILGFRRRSLTPQCTTQSFQSSFSNHAVQRPVL